MELTQWEAVGNGSASSLKKPPVGAVLIMGAGIGGMQAALDLANAGFKVYLADKTTAIGGHMAQLDKTFPTNDCAMCIISPKLVECEKHLNIDILTNTEIEEVAGEAGHFQVRLLRRATYVDREKCNACGDCAAVCPVMIPDEFDENIDGRKAIFKRYPQAIPNVYAITKRDRPPCHLTCPAGTNAQAYIALIAQGKFREAMEVIQEKLPFPGVLGRVCHHPCEAQCNRAQIDAPVAVCALKRFVADYLAAHPEEGTERDSQRAEEQGNGAAFTTPPTHHFTTTPSHHGTVPPTPRVAIVGSGPAGLTAASDLVRRGYRVTVFEAGPEPGGMMRLGIPAYRLPREVLDTEIQAILDLGVELRTHTALGRDVSLADLRRDYQAVFLAIGAQNNAPLGLPGEDLEGVVDCLKFLRRVNLGDTTSPGQRVVVIGGGNSAMDAARTAVRLGCSEVTVLYRRSRAEMPANPNEIVEAEEEGVKFHFLAAPVRVLGENGRVTGLECIRMELGEPDESGRRRPAPVPGSEFTMAADAVIPAIGQTGDFSFLGDQDGLQTEQGRLVIDRITFQTTVPGVFAGGDVVTGAASVVEAIAQGHEVATSIDRYLKGEDLQQGRQPSPRVPAGLPRRWVGRAERQEMAHLPPERRRNSFEEMNLGYTLEQAVAEAQRCLNCGFCSECMQCVKVCQAGAICHEAQDEHLELEVGAIILAPGYDRFEPDRRGEYGYSRYRNVITSLEFERILSASGPYQGQILRPSDGHHPKRIAWIQCVGSRDVPCGHPYCSSICCMYATKEAIIAKEHEADIEATIFYNDIRAFGKGFERYYERAKKEYGVRYVKSIVSTLREVPSSKNLILQYALDDGSIHEEEFDLVVLSVGVVPPEGAREMAARCGVALNAYGFAATGYFTPDLTSRPGIFTCGAFAAPMDIPETVMTASGAAASAASLLAEARGTLVAEKVYPPERDVRAEEPRVGVFVCHCGTNIARVVKVEEVVKYAKTLRRVVYAEHNLYTCSTDAQRQIIDKIREHHLNRVVVSSCTPRTHEPLFRDMLREAGLNKYLFEMANIRDQCSWVHANNPQEATEKAKDLVRMAVARAITLEPIQDLSYPVKQAGLVIGGGLAGMTAALTLADQGFPTTLVERETELGGRLRDLRYLPNGDNPQDYLAELREKVTHHPRITVYTDAEATGFSGHVGDFRTRIRLRSAAPGSNGSNGTTPLEIELEHGALIVATGGVEYKPNEYLYGQDPRVLTQLEWEAQMKEWENEGVGGGTEPSPLPKTVVMIQCVGSRQDDHQYCSRVCCSTAIKNALKLKEKSPVAQVYILYRDIRTYAFRELDYRKAREAGILFLRYDLDSKPEVRVSHEKLEVTAWDPVLGMKVKLQPDYVVLSSAIRPHPTNPELASLLKVPLDTDGFFLEAHLKLRPLDFANEGMFLCGLAHSPKFMDETIAQARGVAARAATILSQESLAVGGTVATVNEEECAACLTCVRICPYDVPIIRDGAAFIDPAQCQGCGTCAAACPARAIQVGHYKDDQILAQCMSLWDMPELADVFSS